MQIKRFTQFIQESFSREEEAQLRNMGLAPTRWYVALTIEISWAANAAPEQIREDFASWVESDFSAGAWQIKPETIRLEDWDPEAFEFVLESQLETNKGLIGIESVQWIFNDSEQAFNNIRYFENLVDNNWIFGGSNKFPTQ